MSTIEWSFYTKKLVESEVKNYCIALSTIIVVFSHLLKNKILKQKIKYPFLAWIRIIGGLVPSADSSKTLALSYCSLFSSSDGFISGVLSSSVFMSGIINLV